MDMMDYDEKIITHPEIIKIHLRQKKAGLKNQVSFFWSAIEYFLPLRVNNIHVIKLDDDWRYIERGCRDTD